MQEFAELCEAVGGTTKKTEKIRLVAGYLLGRGLEEAAVSAVFLSGRPFPAHEETVLNIGGTQLWRVVAELAKKSDAAMAAAYRKHGDLGSATHEVLRGTAPQRGKVGVIEVEQAFRAMAKARGPAAKSEIAKELLRRTTALEAKYIVKIMTGELRIGLKESLVEEAIAFAHDAQLADVQRANMLLGDIGETLRLASQGELQQARMRRFHPIGFMLASPAEDAEEAFSEFSDAQVEDKYDGIRAQAHVAPDEPARIFSRTRDEVTESFPELVPALRAMRGPAILDGEIVAWRNGRALPFSELQKRLGRKKVTRKMMEDVPVAYVAFDVLYTEGELVINRPFSERGLMLDAVFAAAEKVIEAPTTDAQGTLQFEPAVVAEEVPAAEPKVIRAPAHRAKSAKELDEMFEQAQARGNEGLMVKDRGSVYTPGRRGKSWLKLKRELATLDVVVTAVEWGHGKRAKVLSDVTFAVRVGEELLNVGKAYSGLTDAEIAELTQWFLKHTLEDHGHVRTVEPKVVLEVAFNAVMRSDRHDSGYALRFPRILRIRGDKAPEEIDTLERVREIYESQQVEKIAS